MPRRHTISFVHAFDGIRHAFVNQPNLRIHFLFASAALFLGFYLRISHIEFLIILFTIMWVILAEMINTAVESIVDLITEERRVHAKVAKDVAAGSVLIGAIGAVVIGLVIFIPRLIGLI